MKLFDRQAHAGAQIINYRASADGKWHILGGRFSPLCLAICVGVVASSGSVAGILQVYSVLQCFGVGLDSLGGDESKPTTNGRSFCGLSIDRENFRDSPLM